jgi:hypothetical protein
MGRDATMFNTLEMELLTCNKNVMIDGYMRGLATRLHYAENKSV